MLRLVAHDAGADWIDGWLGVLDSRARPPAGTITAAGRSWPAPSERWSQLSAGDRLPAQARTVWTQKVRIGPGLAAGARHELTATVGAEVARCILPWLAYVWGVGLPANPLLSSTGVPSAVFTEAVFGALRQELTPGLATRSSCPEAIWQSARYWYPYYTLAAAEPESRTATSTTRGRTPHGVFVIEQDYAAILPAEEPGSTTPAAAAPPTPAPTPRRRRRT